MGSFANALFSVLLGWLQTFVSLLWSAFTSKDGNSVLTFIGNNWIKIGIILCLIGLIADFAVYLIRWEPYKVWRTFWKKLKGRKAADSSIGEETSFTEDGDFPESGIPPAARPGRFFQEPDDEEELYRWRAAGKHFAEKETVPDIPEDEIQEPENTFFPFPQGTRREQNRRRRVRFGGFLGESEGEEPFRYIAPRPIIDQKNAYNAPVYPERWKESGDHDS